MKKLFLFIALAALMVGCKTEEPVKPFQIDPLATVNIKPKAGAWNAPMKVKSTEGHLSALEIVKQTTALQYNYATMGAYTWERGFGDLQRDTISEIPQLKMWGSDIIDADGEYIPYFIESVDCILLKFDLHVSYAPRDTIAYIPNATLRAAETIIKQAYEAKDMELILNTFNTAFTFIPITGAEYKALKAQGLQ